MAYTKAERCIRRLWSKHKASCRSRGIETELSVNQYQALILGPCSYCGAVDSNELEYAGITFPYNGIDRIQSSDSYRLYNVVTCCLFCNSLKGSMSWSTWTSFLNAVHKRIEMTATWDVEADVDRASKSFYGGR